MEQTVQIEVPVNDEGEYQFLDLEYVDGRVYQITAIVDGIQHSSEVFHNPVVNENGFVDISILAAATTTDISTVYAERMHVFFEFVDADTLQVVELLIIQNASDLVVVPKNSDTPVIAYQLPEGATNLQFERGEIGDRYILTDSGFGDMQPIEPNVPQQFLFAYNLPYENKMPLEIDLPMDVEAAIVMLPANVGVEIKSDQLSFTREQAMQGAAIRTYSSGRLTQEENLKLNFQGRYKASVEFTGVESFDTVGVLIGVGVFLSAIGFGLVFLRRKKNLSAQEELIEEPLFDSDNELDDLLDAVIALDEAHAKGELPDEAYYNRRQEITEKIARLQGEN
jgi:LPXTG-motif cell wall-anchored protein